MFNRLFSCDRSLNISSLLSVQILTIYKIFGRCIFMGRCSSSSSDSHGAEELSEDAAISHSKLMVPGLTKKADVGKISNSV